MKGEKHTFVGNFFEQVGQTILGGDLTRNDDGDISLWKSETCVEVKASGHQSSYGFRLNVEQIERYEKISFFPFSRAWYMLFAYRNGSKKNVDGTRSSELSIYEDPISINKYLAGSVMWCTLVDLSIVSRWKEVLPHSTKSVMGHRGMRTVDLKPKVIHTLTNGGFAEGLTAIGLDPSAYDRVYGEIKSLVQVDLFSRHHVRVPITAILPQAEARVFQRMLRRRGFNFKKVDH